MFYAHSYIFSSHLHFWRQKKEKASPTSVQKLKTMRSAHSLNTQSHGCSNQTIALNRRVYLMKIKLLVQQIQSHFCTPIDQHVGLSKRIDFVIDILLLSQWRANCSMWYVCNTFFFFSFLPNNTVKSRCCSLNTLIRVLTVNHTLFPPP